MVVAVDGQAITSVEMLQQVCVRVCVCVLAVCVLAVCVCVLAVCVCVLRLSRSVPIN